MTRLRRSVWRRRRCFRVSAYLCNRVQGQRRTRSTERTSTKSSTPGASGTAASGWSEASGWVAAHLNIYEAVAPPATPPARFWDGTAWIDASTASFWDGTAWQAGA